MLSKNRRIRKRATNVYVSEAWMELPSPFRYHEFKQVDESWSASKNIESEKVTSAVTPSPSTSEISTAMTTTFAPPTSTSTTPGMAIASTHEWEYSIGGGIGTLILAVLVFCVKKKLRNCKRYKVVRADQVDEVGHGDVNLIELATLENVPANPPAPPPPPPSHRINIKSANDSQSSGRSVESPRDALMKEIREIYSKRHPAAD